MKKSGSSGAKGGIGFTGLLTIAFIVLRLCGVIRWRWIWVLAPAWISVIVVIAVAVFAVVVQVRGGKKR